jgi:membrane fusion protein (multidrug efflux system)
MQDQLITTGTLRADESVELVSEAAGKVTSIQFEEGSRVAEGQLLLTINDAELQAQQKRLEYRLQLAEDRRQRQERLLEEGGVSQETYDQTLNEVNVLEAELELVEAQIEKTRVRAPFSGTIGLRYVSEGSYISPQTRIATLQSINPIKIDLSAPEKYSSRIQTGAPISFTVRGSDARYQGRIYAVEPQISTNTRSVQLRARAENAARTLRPGAFADITVVLGTIDDALTVPAFAVLPELGGQQVFVVENGQAQPRSVETGVRTDSTVQVTSGLAVGDTVITSGIQQLRPGLPIRVENVE